MHPGLEVPVAIKVLAEQYSRDESFRSRFQREAATIAALNHPGIVRVYDFDSDQGALFIVMEFVEGRSLRAWLHEYGRFTVEVANDLIQQMLSAVGAAHDRDVVHRDLKPENVLISTQGKTKILDFGVSKLVHASARLTATGSMVGTPAYMSPEQINSAQVDRRCDIYALGMMLYELIHGEPPFIGSVASVLHSQAFDKPRPSTVIPDALMEIIWKATEKDPAKRFQTCEELAGALLYLPRPGSQPPPTAPPPSEPGRPFKLRLPRLGGLAAPPAAEPVEGQQQVGLCTFTGCTSRHGWQCGYKDSFGRECTTWWCKHHISFIESTPLCPRHTNVIRALKATAGTIREIKNLPSVDDRALPLAAFVGNDVDKDMTEILRRRYQGRKDVTILSDKAVRQSWVGRSAAAWERNWSALHGHGYITRIAIRVTVAQDDNIQLVIGNNVVFEAVPDWIARRRQGGPADHADRARFRKKIIQAAQQFIDQPTPYPARRPTPSAAASPSPISQVNQMLLEGMVLRLFANAPKLTAFEVTEELALPFGNIAGVIETLTAGGLVDALGIAPDTGPWKGRPLPERMSYAITNRGRSRNDEVGNSGTRYVGPAPVSMGEYRKMLESSPPPGQLDQSQVDGALRGLELAPGVAESVRAAVNSRGSVFIYGAPGNGKTSLGRQMVGLLGGPILIPIALEAEGEVLNVFDPAVHRLADPQPADRRWKRVHRPVLQMGGEFELQMLEPTWEAGSRTHQSPLQVKANGGVLLIDDLGRQKVSPKQILDRLLVPLEQEVDYLNLSSGRKVEVPFKCLLTLSTNLKPADLLDEAYLRRLNYKIHMPDPSWDAFCKIFERERERLGIKPNPAVLTLVQHLYGGRPLRGNHPRDLLERLVDVASARQLRPELRPDLIEAAWQTLFLAQ
jgi:predicted Ser/Thr protein kinase